MGQMCPKEGGIYEEKPKNNRSKQVEMNTSFENQNAGFIKLPNISRSDKYKPYSEEDLYDKPGKYIRETTNESQVKGQPLYQVTSEDMATDKFHSYIGALLGKHPMNKNKEVKGTAALISSNLILTAAHNLYDADNNVQIGKHTFYIGVNGTMGKCYQSQSIFYPHQFENLQTAECDYALIKLKEKVTEVEDPNFLQLGFNFKEMFAPLSIFGYPGGKDNYIGLNKDGTIRQTFQRGLQRAERIKSIEDNIINYEISTLPGQSGCPIITGEDKNIIIGVHKGGVKQNKQVFNQGRYVNIDMILRMEIWRQQCNGDRFKVINLQTNKQIDLSSTLFQQLKEMVIQEQKKSTRIKRMYKSLAHNKHIQLQQLHQQIQKFGGEKNFNTRQLIQENDSLKKQLKQSNMDLTNKMTEARELRKTKQDLQKQLSSTKQQLQKMIRQSANQQKFKEQLQNSRQNIIAFENQLKAKQKQLQQKQRQIAQFNQKQKDQNKQLIHLANLSNGNGQLVQWDEKSTFANKFIIAKQTVTMKFDDSIYQITSRNPLLKKSKTVLNFKILNYGGKHQICIGVLCQSRKESIYSGTQKGSVGYFSTPKGDGHGCIVANEVVIEKENNILFIPKGGQLEMTVNLITFEMSFTNREKGKFSKFKLGPEFQVQQVYLFCNMRNKNSSIEII